LTLQSFNQTVRAFSEKHGHKRADFVAALQEKQLENISFSGKKRYTPSRIYISKKCVLGSTETEKNLLYCYRQQLLHASRSSGL
jgi:hypothetical protein